MIVTQSKFNLVVDRIHRLGQIGIKRPAACAGFLLRGAEHNLAVRLKRMTGEIVDDVRDAGHELHANYRAMAVANGVPAEDSALSACRD